MSSAPTSLLCRRDTFVLVLAVAVGAMSYLFASVASSTVGFPLDDSWIHQTYARSLAHQGEWSFRPGQISAGSTAPLWSALLTLGWFLHLMPYGWTYLLGAASLFGLAVTVELGARRIVAGYRPKLPWVGLFVALEWHMLWAAMSGMETILHALLVTATLVVLAGEGRPPLLLGTLTGLSVWVRPDGLTLVGPALAVGLLTQKDTRAGLRFLGLFASSLLAVVIPYFLFNLQVGGVLMPNTFYAKQAEYIAWQSMPLIDRLGQAVLQLIAGPSALLVPGLAISILEALRRRAWAILAIAVWLAGYAGIYIAQLPVYQHGRYLMPAMPAIFLLGLLGVLHQPRQPLVRSRRLLLLTWTVSLGVLLLSFVYVGARAYAEDVEIIEGEMVATAKWSAAHLPPDALIAAHDIGALGFFDHHPLLDLAGLISPEVVPFIRDEAQLARYLDQRGAAYLIAFPEFYPVLTGQLKIVFLTGSRTAAEHQYNSMAIYQWGQVR